MGLTMKWKLRLPPGHFGLLVALTQEAKESYLLADYDYGNEIESLLFNGRRKDVT